MDDVTLRELVLFTENDADIYRRTTTPIVRNLRTKQAQGKYDHDRAADAFMYLAEAGARKYAREHGGGENEWHVIFPIDVRRAAAAAWRDEFEQESALGNYDNATYLPKKYLEQIKTGKKPQKSSRSEAWKSGYRDGTKYVHEHGVTRQEFERRLTTPRQELIRRVGGAYQAIKPLGLAGMKKLTDADYDRAFDEYDEGFIHAANAIFDAMEGN
jgi:hypothetical protein